MATYYLVGGNQHFEGTCCLDLQHTEATGSSETAVAVTIGTTLMPQAGYAPQ
jgi:hypothetical protein